MTYCNLHWLANECDITWKWCLININALSKKENGKQQYNKKGIARALSFSGAAWKKNGPLTLEIIWEKSGSPLVLCVFFKGQKKAIRGSKKTDSQVVRDWWKEGDFGNIPFWGTIALVHITYHFKRVSQGHLIVC